MLSWHQISNLLNPDCIKVPKCLFDFFQIFAENFHQCINPNSLQACAARVRQVLFRQKSKHQINSH